MGSFKVNDGGTWKSPTPWVNDGGTWKKPLSMWVNDGGTWKQVWASLTFTPAPGSYSRTTQLGGASFTLSATQAVVWTYIKSGSVTASQASGLSTTSMSFSCGQGLGGSCNVSVTVNGVTYNWDCSFAVNPA